MVFNRTMHDGLFGVINRAKRKKIVFIDRKYETVDKEECEYLIALGYAYEGELPGVEAPKKTARATWNVWLEGEDKPVHTAKTKKAADDWIVNQDAWAKMETKKAE